ncbi:MAG: T9SS type A sorting domain-containing protein [Bacteroidia bacterium]|nr:T9SS type A sorting domain-containing protein [Bacteroidia bacterium]
MKWWLIIYLCLFATLSLNAQNEVKEWIINKAGAPYNVHRLIDFRSGLPVFTWDTLGCNINYSAALIDNQYGNRLFYSNGTSVFNRKDSIMPNSTNYNYPYGGNFDSINGAGARASPTILPFPSDSLKYYLVHLPSGGKFWTDAYGWASPSLYYSVIDMNLQNGLGDMSLKRVPIIENDTITPASIYTFTRHGNGKDWWLVVPRMNVDSVYIFLLTDTGVVKYPSQCTIGGNQGDTLVIYRRNVIRFSQDGSKLGAYFQRQKVYVYDFNRCTGELSDSVTIPLPTDCISGPSGYMFIDDLLFSNNNTKLYLSLRCRVEQYDLTVSDINGSKVAVYSTSNSPMNGNEWVGYMHSGPDRKIYISANNGASLDVINFPDVSGSGCQYEHMAYTFPNGGSPCFPFYPNYELGPLQGSICDTISTVSIHDPDIESVKVYPNPASDVLTVEVLPGNSAGLILRNALGQVVLQSAVPESGKTQIPLKGIPDGVYFYEVIDDKKVGSYGKVVIQRR